MKFPRGKGETVRAKIINKSSKMVALIVIGCICLSFLFGVLSDAYAASFASSSSQQSWSLTIGSVEEKDGLHTTQYNTNYDGSIDIQQYDNDPSSGNCYAIVGVNATLNSMGQTSILNVSNMKLRIDGNEYSAVTPVSSFLTNHNYTTFTGEQILSSGRGNVAFEIPKTYSGNDGTDWCVVCDNIESPAYAPLGNSVEERSNYVDTQADTEKRALESYKAAGGATLDNPFIVKDLYGNAPLTAVAMFETDTAQSVTVTVHGKSEDCDITYTVSGEQTHHEVPIFGLYAGYKNKVTLSAGGVSSDVTIKTEALPDSVETVDKVGSYGAQQIGQLFVMQSPHQVVFDNNGDVRWYLSEEWSCKKLSSDSSYPLQVTSDGGSFWFCRNRLTSSVYSQGCEFVHMTWLGKVEKLVSSSGFQCDHDFTLANDTTAYFIKDGTANNASIEKLNLETGEVETFAKLSSLFDKSVLPSYPDAWDDLWHINSVQYLEEDNSLFISIRNQSIVAKIDVDTASVKWILSPASGTNDDGTTWARQSAYSDVAIQPSKKDTNFEWFYNTHDANVVSYDVQSGILTFAAFDNGTYRYNFGDDTNNDRYSRMIVYEVNENDKTVKQVRQYGKERGSELYSWWYGSAQVLSNGHFVGDFSRYNETNSSHIIEVDKNSKLVAEYEVQRASCGAYRANVIDVSEGFQNLNFSESSGTEIHKYENNYWQSSSLSDLSNFASLSISDIFRDGNTMSILGTVEVKQDQNLASASVVLSGDKGTYEFPVITLGSHCQIYGLGIPLDSLPDGTYSVYLRATATNGATKTQSLDKSISIGASASETITTSTNVPDSNQEDILESLTTSAAQSTFADMKVVQDPFGISPLTAMALFSTDDLCSVSVTAHGKDSSDDVSYEVEGRRALHEVPIIGLYYNATTEVTIKLAHADGSTETKELSLTTGLAPNENKIANMEVSYDEENASQIAKGLTFCAPSGGTYFYAVDKTGAIRWYYAYSGNIGMDGVSFTDNDHLLILDGGKSASAETNSFSAQEIDLLGRVYNAYYLPNMSFHHELKELPNGNLLGAATDYTKDTINDVIVEINRETGEIARRWDMDEILGRYGIERLGTPSFELAELTDSSGKKYNKNWFHNNCVLYNEADDSLIISSRHQSAVYKIDASTGSVKWVLSDPECYKGTGLESYLLKPVDSSGNSVDASAFEWQYGQHAPMVCADGDIALFDNGNYRTKLSTDRTFAADNYSRVVKYHVDEKSMTVSQVSEFGKELGSEHFCALIGDVDELGEDHYLDSFGGHCLTGPGGDVSDSSGAPYIESALYEVKDGKVIWQMSTTPHLPVRSSAIYRSERVDIKSLAYTYESSYGQQWLGDAGQAKTVELNPSSFTEGLSNVKISKATNEGNRIVLSGTVTNPLSVSNLYVGETYGGKEIYHQVEVATNGSFTARITQDATSTTEGRTFKLYAEMSDGLKLWCPVDFETSGLTTFSSKINGDTTLDLGRETSYSLVKSPSNAVDASATWVSSNSGVLEIDASGNARAVSPGVTVLSAKSSDNGTSAQMVVTVTGSTLSESSVSLRRDESSSVPLVTLGDNLGSISWSSSNEEVATVDENGLIRGIEPGECIVYAQADERTFEVAVKVSNTIADGVYTLASALDESMVIDIAGGSSSDRANAQLYKDNATDAQQFRLEYQGSGMYTISSLCSDKPLEVQDGGTKSGTNVCQNTADDSLGQKWLIDIDDSGYWTITSALNGNRMDVAGASKSNGANIQTYKANGTKAQQFKLVKRFENGIYRIESKLKGDYVLDISGASSSQANAQMWTKNRSDAQLMLIRYAGEGAYEIRSLCSGYALDIAGASTSNGANVQQYEANGTKAQRWYLRANEDGSYRLVSALSGKCLDVDGAKTKKGTNVQVWSDNGTDAQSFNLISAGCTVSLQSAINQNYCLDVAGCSGTSGANIQLYKANGTAAQKFYLSEFLDNGERYLLSLTGFCSLDVAGGSSSNGANVQQWALNGTEAQRWLTTYYGSDKYGISSAISGKALDVTSGRAQNGQNIQIYDKNDTDAQRFVISFEAQNILKNKA